MLRVDLGKNFIQRIKKFESQTEGFAKLIVDLYFLLESSRIASVNEVLSEYGWLW